MGVPTDTMLTRDGTDPPPIPTDSGPPDKGNLLASSATVTTLHVDRVTFWAMVGGSVAGAVLLLIVIVFFIRRYQRNRKGKASFDSTDLEDYSDFSTSHSAPESRCGTPPPRRSGSLRRQQHIYRTPSIQKQPSLSKQSSLSDRQSRLVKSLTVESIPDFSLPPERVQPLSPDEKRLSQSSFQYQQSFLGNVQPDLYRFSEEEDEGDAPPPQTGRMWFSAVYDAAVEQLVVKLVKAKHLPGRGKSNTPRDPFVKLYLLPDESTCHQSKVRRKTLAPKFNESFTFQVPAEEVTKRTLRLSLYDVDKRRVRHSLGHVLAPLCELDLSKNDNEAVIWRDLEPASQASTSLGEINISLTYVPTLDKIKVVILRARNLRKLDLDVDTGVYIKVHLCHGRKLQKTKKTAVQRGTCEPVYNESVNFGVQSKHLDSCNLVFSIMTTSHSPLSHDDEYARVTVGGFLFSRGEELLHWQDMVAQPRTAVTKWHALVQPITTHSS